MAVEIQSQKLLIVGGCGYFGSRIVRWLVHETKKLPSSIAVVDRVKPSLERREQGVTYNEIDTTDAQAISKVINDFKPDAIIHTASPHHSFTDLKMFMLNNVEGTRNLLDTAVAQPSVKAFLYTSSSSVTHDTVSDLIEATEDSRYVFIPEQRQAYSHSKAVAEQLALTYNRKRKDFVVAAIRPSVMFGPGERAIINDTVERGKRGSLRYQIGDGNNAASFTYVDNTVSAAVLIINALLRAVENPGSVKEDMRVEGEAFIITNDEHRKFWDFFRDVGAAAGYPTDPSQIVVIPKSLAIGVASFLEWVYWLVSFGTMFPPVRSANLTYSTITRTLDISKAKKRLGYRPRYSLDEGIRLSVAPLLTDPKND